ncbi:hypothetical protein BDW02DRAFT_590613 [Decorospora gaudefroyi]|uniref:RING-type domain-containing protein n=1 Tax=Decorospora gaudefroyi TaxID=184978 RepID=A0A6A5KBH9_9PLEO|nr:hypothetical protein BDW02DRAFT_590613 [Decorospora gaudefroyi]
MGSKFSRALRPHVTTAAASPIAPTQHPDIDGTNADENCQEASPHLPRTFGRDDINIAASSTTPTLTTRRDSAPASPAAIAVSSTVMEQLPERAAAFNLFLAEHRLMSIQYADTDPDAPTTIAPPTAPTRSPILFEDLDVQCIICCEQLPKHSDPKHAKEVIRPCICSSTFCAPCIKNMFITACKDTTRMPPRCCTQIQLRYAKPYLTHEETGEFKAKYEEWLTPKPFYCPVPTCSAFIPERLLPIQTRAKGKRADSGIGTPTSKSFACPTCDAGICGDCRQVAHPNSLCNVSEFGVDAETTELLKSWGYKQCPKCGHGLKRMWGCNHMECRCGAHFCYVCLGKLDDCDGGCADEEDYSDDDGEDEGLDDAEENALPPAENTSLDPANIPATGESPSTDPLLPVTPTQPIPRPRNLDAGGHNYWEESNIDFGDEPTGDIQNRSWNCTHNFSTYQMPLAKALAEDPSTAEMECVKCWCTIHAEIIPPVNAKKNENAKVVPATGRLRRGGRGRYLTPRGLFRADATIGTAPHLTTTLASALSQSVPDRQSWPMEDVRYSASDRVVDTYGNVIETTEVGLRRRASDGEIMRNSIENGLGDEVTTTSRTSSSNVFPSATPAKFSFAYECSCGLLLCASCKDDVMAVQDIKQGEDSEE